MGKRRSASKRPGLWETPGGKTEDGETSEAALVREWREELNLEIVVGDWISTTPILDLEVKFIVELYCVEIVSTELWEKRDHDDIAWIDPVFAVERMPCSPAFYFHYPAIRAWFQRRRNTATSL